MRGSRLTRMTFCIEGRHYVPSKSAKLQSIILSPSLRRTQRIVARVGDLKKEADKSDRSGNDNFDFSAVSALAEKQRIRPRVVDHAVCRDYFIGYVIACRIGNSYHTGIAQIGSSNKIVSVEVPFNSPVLKAICTIVPSTGIPAAEVLVQDCPALIFMLSASPKY